MADKSSQLMLAALTRAAADPNNVPLLSTRAAPGLFPATAAGKQAAQRCRDEGYLGDDRAITERGMRYLFEQVSPRQVLEDFVRVLEAREKQVHELGSQVCSMLAGLEAMRGHLAQVLGQLDKQGDLKALCRQFHERPDDDPSAALLACIKAWRGPDDMPLPELYAQAMDGKAGATIGAFHDALRQLDEAGRVCLHPWTGPLYEVPEPRFALLVGHQISYYVSHAVKE
ncbi:MAG: hypothetical protein ACRC33_28245 [Gemmataceae bacterium]